MPAKKTFSSIRVRGVAHFDHILLLQGHPVAAFREYVARLVYDKSLDTLTVTAVHSDFSALNWVHITEGQWKAQTTETLDDAKFAPLPIPSFFDGDGDRIDVQLFVSNDIVTFHSSFFLRFYDQTQDLKDPFDFVCYVQFRLYK